MESSQFSMKFGDENSKGKGGINTIRIIHS
jgi:hypothetical protein